MKVLALCALAILALMLPWIALSQSSAQLDETLEIKGVQLWLGMDENAVAKKLRAKNLGVSEPPELTGPRGKTWILCESPDDKDCDSALGQVSFEDGRVNVITKRWIETKDAAEVVVALYGATKDLEKRGFTHCQLASKETFDPGTEVKYVQMRCTEHLSLSVIHMHSAITPSLVAVQEMLLARK